MPDAPNPVPAPKPGSAKPTTEHDAGHVPMSEELDRAKWTLPPIVPVLIAAGLVPLVVVTFGLPMHGKPVAAGTVVKLTTAEQEGNTMVGVQVKRDNKIENLISIKDISSELKTADGNKYPDHAAPDMDAGRYLQAF